MTRRYAGIWALLVASLALLMPAAPAWSAPREHPVILLHIAAPSLKNACGLTLGCNDVVTNAEVCNGSASYFVYLLAGNGAPDTTNTLAGVEFGIEATGLGPGSHFRINSWRLCATLEFPFTDWPESGSGNIVTWDPERRCQTGELGVAGYFYVTPYGPASMQVTPRPISNLAKVAACNAAENIVYPGRLGVVTFGPSAGFNPCVEPPSRTEPYVWIGLGADKDSLDNDDLLIGIGAIDDVTPREDLEYSWRLDGGDWGPAPPLERGWRTIELNNLPRGPHTIEAQVRDAAGEIGAALESFRTVVDPNDAPRTIILSGPAEGDTVVGGSVTFTWTGTDDRTAADSLQFVWSLDSQAIWVGSDYAPPVTSVTYDDLSAGPHVFHVNAFDLEHEVERSIQVRHFYYRLPTQFAIRQVMPNPSRGPTTIVIDVARASRISVTIHDPQGRRIRTLMDADCPPGRTQIPWDGTNEAGTAAASGVYFVRMSSVEGSTSQTLRVVR